MKTIIFGATGNTGVEIVKHALEKGHTVTAFVRDPAKLTIENKNLTIVEGDIFNEESVSNAIKSQDVVICSLGSKDLSKTDIRATGTMNIVKAMESNKVSRLLVVSAMGVSESWSTLSFMGKLIFATLLRASRQDHEAQEKIVRESNLNWTIFRPSGLNDNPMTEDYLLGENISAITSQIPRADVAHAIVSEMSNNNFLKKAITITN